MRRIARAAAGILVTTSAMVGAPISLGAPTNESTLVRTQMRYDMLYGADAFFDETRHLAYADRVREAVATPKAAAVTTSARSSKTSGRKTGVSGGAAPAPSTGDTGGTIPTPPPPPDPGTGAGPDPGGGAGGTCPT